MTDAAVFKALLREALHKRVSLTVDVFKDFDKGDGNIDKKGFRKALKRLGLSEKVPRKQVDTLFGSWDADCSGSLGIAELRKVLRSERKGADGIMSDDAAALLESRAREAKRQALKDQAAARRAMNPASERSAKADRQQVTARNSVESLYRDLGVHGKEALELFGQWDVDGDGVVSRAEFRRAMEVLGLGNEKTVIDSLFDLMDYDDSGDITTVELEQALAWAQSKGRNEKILTNKPVKPLGDVGTAERESGGLLYDAMMQNSTKVIELFKFLDQNEDGAVSKKEFRRAPALLGIKLPPFEVDSLFDAFDADGLGILSFKELTKLLHHDVKLKQKSRRRLAQEEELQVVDIEAMRRIVKEQLTIGELESYIPVKKNDDDDPLASKAKPAPGSTGKAAAPAAEALPMALPL